MTQTNKQKNPVVDAKARQAALDITDSVIVQAPAGSGKTGLLTQRFLALLAHANEPEDILAITFTHKASGEMRARILGSLQRARDITPPDETHEQLTWELARAALAQNDEKDWGLINNPGRLRVQTIDSLCASLTRQMPLLSTFGSQPSIAEDAYRLYNEAARKTLSEIESGESWSPHIEHLLKHLDNDLHRVEELLASMLARRDHWFRHIADGGDERVQRHTLEAVLHDIIEEHLMALGESVPTDLIDELISLAKIAATNLNEMGIDSDIHACISLSSCPGHNIAHLPVWRGLSSLLLTDGSWRKSKGINKNQGFPPEDKSKEKGGCQNAENKKRMQELLGKLTDHEQFRQRLADLQYLPEASFAESQWDILQAVIELLPVAVAQLHLVFRAHGAVDFSEIAQRAVQALGDSTQPTDLALVMDYRIQHILVDEFQDTSFSQYQLLERLTAGWESGDGRTLFLVGDPMQSIYRFREAEVALYLRARRKGVGSISLTPLTLSVNFRSQDPVVDWFNNTFPQVFPEKENLTTGAVVYTNSEPFHSGDLDRAVHIYPCFEDNAQTEAGKVIEIVQQLRSERPEETIAILVRARSHLKSVVGLLADADLGFRAVEIEHLKHRQSVVDLMSLTRALSHLADRVAWIALLRAPWCGLTLADIEHLIGGEKDQLVWQLLLDRKRWNNLKAESKARLARIVKVFKEALRNRQKGSLRTWVEDTWLALGGPATLSAQRDLADCEQYFKLLCTMELDGLAITAGSLQTQVDKLYASTDPFSDERLQIMTIHKAKGLEFDSVILPGLGRKSPSGNTRLLNWAERAREDKRSDLILAPISASGEDKDSINTYLRYLDRLREQNESVRLLYVAATRARRTLHILGHTRTKERKDSVDMQPPTAGSLLATLWPAVEKDYSDAMGQENDSIDSKTGTASYADIQGITRLSANWKPPIELKSNEDNAQASDEMPVEYSWVGPAARHVGTVVHHLLEQLVLHGADTWPNGNQDMLRKNINNELVGLGVPTDKIASATKTVFEAVERTLTDERGQWILDNSHSESQCEYALLSLDEEKNLMTSIIDRTFIDQEGARWIIDYKTSSHSGSGVEEFLDRQKERYEGQLNRYAKTISGMEDNPVKLGLYFPLLGGWREWQ